MTPTPEDMQKYPFLCSPTHGYIFVVTYGRSGSTLLMKLLNSIPGACIRGENANSLAPVLKSIHFIKTEKNIATRMTESKKPVEEQTDYWAKLLGTPNDPWFGSEKIDADTYAKAMLDTYVRHILNPPENVSFLGFKDIRFHESFYNIFEKDAQFGAEMGYILEYFPNSKIIFQTRNVEQVAVSGWWRTMNQEAVLKSLREADRMFLKFRNENPDRCLMFDHSAYAQGFDGVRGIFDFLGVAPDAENVNTILGQRLRHLK